ECRCTLPLPRGRCNLIVRPTKAQPMYEAVTEGIRIKVTPEYLEEQSSPDESYYFWAYTIEIANEGDGVAQLKTRHWRITDANGKIEEVRGPGVVGKTP